jgi:hypothetical protein
MLNYNVYRRLFVFSLLMKHVALLFAIYLSVLTVAPVVLKAMPCIGKTECMETHDGCNKKTDCNKKGKTNCPFGICCNNCLFFHKQSQEISFEPTSTTRTAVFRNNENILSAYLADCWHPPKIVFYL